LLVLLAPRKLYPGKLLVFIRKNVDGYRKWGISGYLVMKISLLMHENFQRRYKNHKKIAQKCIFQLV
jgi:hypothetical protein